jgi:hypothetical protein
MFVCMPVRGFKVVSMVDVKQQAQMTHRCHGTYHCKKIGMEGNLPCATKWWTKNCPLPPKRHAVESPSHVPMHQLAHSHATNQCQGRKWCDIGDLPKYEYFMICIDQSRGKHSILSRNE